MSFFSQRWPEIAGLLAFVTGGAALVFLANSGFLPSRFFPFEFSLVDGFRWNALMASMCIFLLGGLMGGFSLVISFVTGTLAWKLLQLSRPRTCP